MGTPAMQDDLFTPDPEQEQEGEFIPDPEPDQEPVRPDYLYPEVAFEPPVVAKPTQVTTSGDAQTGWRNPFGLSDEMAYGYTKLADLASGREPIPRQIGRGMNQPLDPRSEAQIAQDYELEQQKAAQKRSPWAYGGSQAADETAITAPLALPAKGAQALGAFARAVKAAKVGAGFGAASGYGHSEAKDLAGQAQDTGLGALVGGITAPLVGEVTHQVVTAAKPLRDLAVRKITDWRTGRAVKAVEEQAGGDLAEFARKFANPQSTEGQGLRAMARQGASPEAMEEHGRSLAQDVSQTQRALDAINSDETIKQKSLNAGRYMTQEAIDPKPAVQSTDALIQDIADQVAGWKQETVKGTPDYGVLTRVENAIKQYKLSAPPMSGEPSYAEAAGRFREADQVKREMQRVLANAQRSSPNLEAIHQVETQLRAHLEAPGVWGTGTAEMQQAHNKAWTNLLSLNTRDKSPKQWLTDVEGIPSARSVPYRDLELGDPVALRDIARGAGTLEGEQTAQKLRKWGGYQADLGEALTQSRLDPNPELTALAQGQRQAAERIGGTLDTATAEQQAARRLQQIRALGTPPSTDSTAMLGGNIGAGVQMLQKISKGSPTALADRAQALANLENQVSLGNPAAKRAVDALRGVPLPLDQGRGTVVSTTQGMAARAVSNDRARQGQTQGHDLADKVTWALEQNPGLLGPYAEKFRDKDPGQVLLKLQSDPQWRDKYLPKLSQ